MNVTVQIQLGNLFEDVYVQVSKTSKTVRADAIAKAKALVQKDASLAIFKRSRFTNYVV